MRINGAWIHSDDGIHRPIVVGAISSENGTWRNAELLLDTGADRTVLTADYLHLLGPTPLPTSDQLSGVGGEIESVEYNTQIKFLCDDGQWLLLQGRFAVVTKLEALDVCVLRRDVLNLFSAIVDWPKDVVVLLADPHSYTIGEN